MSEIKICPRHKKKVPLLWTFKFYGSEYWCPYCGYNAGMFGAGIDIPYTRALEEEREQWKKKSGPFLSGETDEWRYEKDDTND